MIIVNDGTISVGTNVICCEEFIVKGNTMFINFLEAKDQYHGKRPWQSFVVAQHRRLNEGLRSEDDGGTSYFKIESLKTRRSRGSDDEKWTLHA